MSSPAAFGDRKVFVNKPNFTSSWVFGCLMVKPGQLVTNVTIWLLEPLTNIIEGWVDAFDWIRNHTCATLQVRSYMLSNVQYYLK